MAEQTGNLTFGIIKPGAVRAGKTGAILQRITDAGFRLRALKLIHMTMPEAEGFYAVHRVEPFGLRLRHVNELQRAQAEARVRDALQDRASLPGPHRAGLDDSESEIARLLCHQCSSGLLND